MAKERHNRALGPAKKWATSWPEYVYPLAIGAVTALLLWLFGESMKTAWIALIAVVAVAVLAPVAIYVGAWFKAGRDLYREAHDKITALAIENDRLEGRVGTWIPAGWNAIIMGPRRTDGEWVPPGFQVVMGPGPISDANGNNIMGTGNRIYNFRASTAIGSGSQVGVKPW